MNRKQKQLVDKIIQLSIIFFSNNVQQYNYCKSLSMQNRVKKSNSSYTPSSNPNSNLLLPHEIATSILDIELEIELGQMSKQKIMQLLALYSQAIEFYQEKNDTKYKLYQQKIQNIVKKPEVNRILNGGVQTETQIKNKQREVLGMKKDAERSAKEQAKTIIKFYNGQIEKQANKIQSELQKQKKKILERVRTRSLSKNKISNPENNSTTETPNQKKVEPIISNIAKIQNSSDDPKIRLVMDALQGLRNYQKKHTKKVLI